MQENRTKTLLLLGGLVGLCLVTLLCTVGLGGYAWTSYQRAQPAITDPLDPERTQNASKGENELVLLGQDPPTLDPALASDAASAGYIVELFSGLVKLDPELNVVPDLAEEWQISEAGTQYTFTLLEGATFADGSPITADDFKYSLERVCDPATQSPVADTYLGDIVGCRAKLLGEAGEVSGVRVIDERTLELTIDEPKVYFLAKLTYPTAFVVDQAAVEAGGRLWAVEAPNGSGPFMLDEYNFGNRLALVPNPNYYGSPKPSIDRAVYILSGGSGMTLYETDEIDVTGIGVADLDRVLDPSSPLNADVREIETMSVTYIGLNADTPPFDDPLVRQAFNLALDTETLVRVVGRGLSTPADGILPPGLPQNEALEPLAFDPERARQLLADSSYGGAEGLPDITLHISGQGGTAPETTEAIVAMWQENLGVTVNIEQSEWATFLLDIARKPNPYQAFSVAWIADYPDPQNFLDILFHCESRDNKTGYCNPAVDALLEEARVEQDAARRLALYHEAEQRIISDAAWVPLWYNKGYALVKPWVEGYLFPATIVPQLQYVEIRHD